MDKVDVSGGNSDPLSRKLVRKFTKAVIAELFTSRRPAQLNVILTDDDEIIRLNRDFRQKNEPTDVLSFEDDTVLPNGKHFLGEIYVSVPFADRTRGENELNRYVLFLVAHGLLHLSGIDHKTENERLEMIKLGEELLGKFA
ncbi:MAG: rRNA maturation RNase YbeY [Caldisericia bacterium]|nr:rRNA maturation RNase YbeY [Caldisericia bacterium]